MSRRRGTRKTRRRMVYGRASQNRFSMVLIGMVVVAIFAVVAVRSVSLLATLREYEETKAELESEIASETERTQEIEEYAKYTQTDEYVEEVARDKLGLVKEGEILFRSDEDAGAVTEAGDASGDESGETGEEDGSDEAEASGEEEESGDSVEPADGAEESAVAEDSEADVSEE